jgi:hypothetical protein
MRIKNLLAILFFFLLSSGNVLQSQHCPFETTRICIISIDDSLLAGHKRVELVVVDSSGQEVLSTEQKRKQYILDQTPDSCTNTRFFFFGKIKKLNRGDHFYALSKNKTVRKQDYFLAMHQNSLTELFKDHGYFHLRIQTKKGEVLLPKSNQKIHSSSFQSACTGKKFWRDQDEMEAFKFFCQ